VIYVDTSAIMKAVRHGEPDADEIRELLASDAPLVSSRLLELELRVSARRHDVPEEQVDLALSRIAQVAIGEEVIEHAIALPGRLRSLDALHLGTARFLGELVTGVLTYDERMREAATAAGIPLAPAPPPRTIEGSHTQADG